MLGRVDRGGIGGGGEGEERVIVVSDAYLRSIIRSAVDYLWRCIERTTTECV